MIYRAQQLWWALRAKRLTSGERAEIAHHLARPELELFERFSWSDQAHALRVLRLLQKEGHDDPDLLTAALLHDIGKTELTISVVDRCVIVLGSILLPNRAEQWGMTAEPPYRWSKPFVLKMRHAEWGAVLAEEVGSSPLAVQLIRRHQDEGVDPTKSDEDQLLAWLQSADNLC